MKNCKVLFFFFFFFCFSVQSVEATRSITNRYSGSWYDNSIWEGGSVPSTLDKVTVAAGTTVTVYGGYTDCDSLIINGFLDVGPTNFTVGGRDLQIDVRAIRNTSCIINGGLRINGDWDSQFKVYGNVKFNTGSTFDMTAGKIMIDGAAFTPELSVPANIPLLDVTDAANFNFTGGLIVLFNPHYFPTGITIKGSKHFHAVAFGNNISLSAFAARTTNDFKVSETDKPIMDAVYLAYLPHVSHQTKVILNEGYSVETLTITSGTLVGSGRLKISSDLYIGQNGRIERDIEMNGASEQKISSISGNTSAIIKGNMFVNNPTTVQNYIDLEFQNGTINFQQGRFDLVDKKVTLNSPAIGANASRYFITKNNYSANGTLVIKNLSGNTLFPVGTTNDYLPVNLTTNFGDFSVSTRPLSIYPQNGYFPINYQWDIQRLTGTAEADVQVQWTSSIENYNFSIARSGCRLFRNEGGNWNPISPTYGPNNISGSVFTKLTPNVHDFTAFTMLAQTIIPVTLKDFVAKERQNDAVLTWQTASELNNVGFDIEKSTDATHFNAIGFVKGVGNSTALNTYNFTDNQFSEAAYYRLKQLDINGQFTYSPIVSLQKNKGIAPINIYPNLITTEPFLTVDIRGKLEDNWALNVSDVNGRVVFQSKLTKNQQSVAVPVNDLAKGTYVIRVINGQKTEVSKFVKN